jgi:thymidylate synthase
MLGQLTGYEPAQYVHTVSDAHIYEDQIELLEPMLERESRAFPTVNLTTEGKKIKDIHDFRAEHFEITDYNPHPSIPKIPVAT